MLGTLSFPYPNSHLFHSSTHDQNLSFSSGFTTYLTYLRKSSRHNFFYNFNAIAYFQVLKVQNNWQTVSTNLFRYRSQNLQDLLDNTQGATSQNTKKKGSYRFRNSKHAKFDQLRTRLDRSRLGFYRILIQPNCSLSPLSDQSFRSISHSI